MEFKIDKIGLDKCRNNTVDDIISLLKTNNKVGCVRYTGFGKSYYIIPKLIDKLEGDILIIVPNIALLQQYTEYFIDTNRVKLLTYQIIKNIDNKETKSKYKNIKYIICDECHHLGNNVWRKELDRFNDIIKAKVIGMTATPVRGDGINVIKTYFNNVQVEALELIDGINQQFLPKIKYIVAYAEVEDKYNSRFTEVDRYRIKNLLNVSNILKKHIEEENLKHNPKILVYVPNIKYINEAVKQCEEWFKEFTDCKTNIYAIHSYKNINENYKILERFRRKHQDNIIDVMVSVDMITEGLHLPNTSIEIMLRKTKSPVKYFQQLGRVINNKQPIVFDLINNSRHLYQIKREYELNNTVGIGRKDKIKFEDCVALIDETKDVLDILSKYNNTNRIDDVTRLQILNDVQSGMAYKDVADKYNIAWQTVCKILKEFNFVKCPAIPDEELHKLYEVNKDYILKSNGTVARTEICDKLGLSDVSQLHRLYKLENIKRKRKYEPLNKSLNRKDEFISLYKSFTKKNRQKLILEKMGIDKRTYSGYLRDRYVRDKIIITKNVTKDEEIYIANYIKQNNNLCQAELSKVLGRSTITIRKIKNKYDLKIPEGKKQTRLNKNDELEIVKAYKKLGSLYKVHKELGYHKNTIKKVVLKYNLVVNPPVRKS